MTDRNEVATGFNRAAGCGCFIVVTILGLIAARLWWEEVQIEPAREQIRRTQLEWHEQQQRLERQQWEQQQRDDELRRRAAERVPEPAPKPKARPPVKARPPIVIAPNRNKENDR
jgi:hypothetical protein